MKKFIAILLGMIMIISFAACESDNNVNDENKSSSSQIVEKEDNDNTNSMPSNSDNETIDGISEEKQKEYNELAQMTITAYINNSVVINESFHNKPDDFLFPQEIPEIVFEINEMGYFSGKINSEDNKYEMWFSIDDTIYDESKPEDNPKVNGVMFQEIE